MMAAADMMDRMGVLLSSLASAVTLLLSLSEGDTEYATAAAAAGASRLMYGDDSRVMYADAAAEDGALKVCVLLLYDSSLCVLLCVLLLCVLAAA